MLAPTIWWILLLASSGVFAVQIGFVINYFGGASWESLAVVLFASLYGSVFYVPFAALTFIRWRVLSRVQKILGAVILAAVSGTFFAVSMVCPC
jgi:hypothetical protein